jgi:hypothetical protein
MSLFRTSVRPPAILSDEAIERYVQAIRHELQPDPLYRRRLRGIVLNRYVAVREGTIHSARPRAAMSRIGRAVLVASFTLAIGVTSVMAASQEALPGEWLYPLKQRVEQMRIEILPAHLHDDLAAAALGERIDELAGLALRGDDEGAAALTVVIEHDYEELVAGFPQEVGGINRQLVVLDGLLERLPEQARLAVADVLDHLATDGAAEPGEGRRNDERGVGPVRAESQAPAPVAVPEPEQPATPRPASSPKPMRARTASPTPSPSPMPTDPPAPTPTEAESPEPATVFEPTPRPTPKQPEDRQTMPQGVPPGD